MTTEREERIRAFLWGTAPLGDRQRRIHADLARADLDSLLSRLHTLEGRFEKYARHLSWCDITANPIEPCNCGFDEPGGSDE